MTKILDVDLDDDLYLQIDIQISDDEFRIITFHIPTNEFHNHVHTKTEYENLIR